MKFNIEKGNFTMTFNDIFTAKLDGEKLRPEAWGLYIFMLSLPEDWDFTIRGLVTVVNAGKNKIQRLLKDLELAGFIERKQGYRNGKFGKIEYTILRQPKKVNNNNKTNNKNAEKTIDKTVKNKQIKTTENEKNSKSPCPHLPCPQNRDTNQSTKEQNINTDKLKIKGNKFPPNYHFLLQELITKKVISIFDRDLKTYNDFFFRVDKEYDYETVLDASRYVSDYYLKTKPKLYNKTKWITSSIENNIVRLEKRKVTDDPEWLDDILELIKVEEEKKDLDFKN
jgi:predicted transcriptional regulator